jgi:hypothetical protein
MRLSLQARKRRNFGVHMPTLMSFAFPCQNPTVAGHKDLKDRYAKELPKFVSECVGHRMLAKIRQAVDRSIGQIRLRIGRPDILAEAPQGLLGSGNDAWLKGSKGLPGIRRIPGSVRQDGYRTNLRHPYLGVQR